VYVHPIVVVGATHEQGWRRLVLMFARSHCVLLLLEGHVVVG